MAEASEALVKSIGYENAGTIEYLVDDNENFYFMEMNTRIQVEHPITEEVRGCDLIKEQIRIAAGDPGLRACDRNRSLAWAFHRMSHQCRRSIQQLHTLKPRNDRPLVCSGWQAEFASIRMSTPVTTVPPHYDSMIAKLIVTGFDAGGGHCANEEGSRLTNSRFKWNQNDDSISGFHPQAQRFPDG